MTDTLSLWEEAPRVTSSKLNTVIAVDSQIAVAAGWDGTIVRTTNQGKTWLKLKNDSIFEFSSLIKTNNGNLFMIGNDMKNGMHSFDGIFASKDKGLNWEHVKTADVWRLFFNPFDNSIWGLNNSSCFISKDECKTWERIEFQTSNIIRTIGFYDKSTIYVGGDGGTLFYTSNNGVNWDKVAEGSESGPLSSIHFLKDTIVITGEDYSGVALVSKVGQDNFKTLIPKKYPPVLSVSHSGKYWWFLKEEGVFFRTNASELETDPVKIDVGFQVAPTSISWLGKTGIGYFVTKTGNLVYTNNHGLGSCTLNILTSPLSTFTTLGSSSGFKVSSNDSDSKIQWQTKVSGLEWINLQNNNTYSNVNSDSLIVSNITVNNHNQLFRAIVNNNLCKDTSETATLTVLDTCVNKLYDTVKVTVADTLIIKTKVTGIQENKYYTFLIYPNPTSTQVIIDCGDNTEVSAYSYTITNSLGQEKLTSKFTSRYQQIDISGIGGTGLYIITIKDSNNTVIETRKILIQ
jgi:photosystem II stability/assembly factor-like uncharacterized protein